MAYLLPIPCSLLSPASSSLEPPLPYLAFNRRLPHHDNWWSGDRQGDGCGCPDLAWFARIGAGEARENTAVLGISIFARFLIWFFVVVATMASYIGLARLLLCPAPASTTMWIASAGAGCARLQGHAGYPQFLIVRSLEEATLVFYRQSGSLTYPISNRPILNWLIKENQNKDDWDWSEQFIATNRFIMSSQNFTEAGLFLPVRMSASGEILIQQNQLRVNSYAVIGKMKVDKCWERERKQE
jgi:hypothetical protein